MKKLLLSTAFALFLLPTAANAQDAQTPAPQTPAPKAKTAKIPSMRQVENTTCAGVKEAEAKLDTVYKAVQKQYSYDPLFLQYLDQSQQAWNAYRDAELKAVYPPNYRQSYGTTIIQCECLEATRLNNLRIDELNRWISGTFEGNSCAGTLMKIQPAPTVP